MGVTVSAIVPTFNDTAVIGRALDTLAGQTEPFLEILVVDDGSTDGRSDELSRLVAGTRGARLIRLPENRGVVAALNVGLAEAAGDYVLLCSANDWYDRRLVEHCRRLLAAHPTVGAISGTARIWNEARRQAVPAIRPRSATPKAYSVEELIALCRRSPAVSATGYVIRRDTALACGGLDPALRWHSDWFLFRAIAFTDGYGFVPEAFGISTVGAGARYSDGASDWAQERVVLRAFARRLRTMPTVAAGFRRGGLFPRYDLRALWLLRGAEDRWMITPLLVWRMCVHSVFYRARHLVPRSLVLWFRQSARS